jgi:hypothetical protein
VRKHYGDYDSKWAGEGSRRWCGKPKCPDCGRSKKRKPSSKS